MINHFRGFCPWIKCTIWSCEMPLCFWYWFCFCIIFPCACGHEHCCWGMKAAVSWWHSWKPYLLYLDWFFSSVNENSSEVTVIFGYVLLKIPACVLLYQFYCDSEVFKCYVLDWKSILKLDQSSINYLVCYFASHTLFNPFIFIMLQEITYNNKCQGWVRLKIQVTKSGKHYKNDTVRQF